MMKKITDLIVKQRNVILVIFVILAGLSAVVMGRVEVNRDMTAYLPESSELRAGLDVMEVEFGEATESSLTVMLEGLEETEKREILEYLRRLEQVIGVEYDGSDEYNRDGFTRYVLTISGGAESEVATAVYDEIEEHFAEMKGRVTLGGEVAEANHEVLPMWIVGLAVGCALVILIVMSDSYVEPFLFLVTILIAVLLNKGTNLIFPSVSNITDSITAILQLALSMDYSIMLMNRYRQEKMKTSDKVEAMKQALHHAFGSISSSSVTTIVGLLALVFMSFTIGRDMGFVLAKGVLFSLLAIFTCLPGLILLCDKAITKTKKKSPTLKLNFLGKMAYKVRYVAILVFVVIFGLSYVLQGNLGITYTDNGDDRISQVFGNENQIAILYESSDEKRMAEYCRDLQNEEVNEVLCYGNTIGQSLTADEMPVKMQDLGMGAEIEDDLLRLVYYHYYRKGGSGRMSLAEFVEFVEEEVYINEKFSSQIDTEMRTNLAKLGELATADAVLGLRNGSDIAQVLGIPWEQMYDLLVYYNAYHVQARLTVGDLVSFLTEYVAMDAGYGASIDATTWAQLGGMMQVMDRSQLETGLTVTEAAEFLGVDVQKMSLIYSLYEINWQNKAIYLSLYEFVGFLMNNVVSRSEFAGQFDQAAQMKIYAVNSIMNQTLMGATYTAEEFADTLAPLTGELEQDLVDVLYIYRGSKSDYNAGWQLTIEEFIKYLNDGVLVDRRLGWLIEDEMRTRAEEALDVVGEAKKMLVGDRYSRVVLNTSLGIESEETFEFLKDLHEDLSGTVDKFYVVGDSMMPYEMSQTFGAEMNMITVITMIFIFAVVALTFRSVLIPVILVLLIQCAVFMTMGILSVSGTETYFIALLIVQSILMGATIDYAILYTSYYLEIRVEKGVKMAVVEAYNKSIHAIATSSSILIIVTLIVGACTSGVTAMILNTISAGTICATLLIMLLLPAMLAACDKIIVRKKH